MIERLYLQENQQLEGRDSLIGRRAIEGMESLIFQPNKYYADYYKIHKVLVGNNGGKQLEEIGDNLSHEQLPQYLEVAGWALAESGLVQDEKPAAERVELINRAEDCWQREIESLESLQQSHMEIVDETDVYRAALNLVYTPIMKSIVVGDVTESVRERAFADTLAIAELSAVQLSLANTENNTSGVSAHSGFLYECNALMALLYANDPQRIPIPSSARSGSGCEYRDQTHDIDVIHQKWGKIHRVTPIEIKASASANDRRRYRSLIVRGKMHLSVPGKSRAIETLRAFSEVYNRQASKESLAIAENASSTIRDLLILYQKGEPIPELKEDTPTTFHDIGPLAVKYAEFTPPKPKHQAA